MEVQNEDIKLSILFGDNQVDGINRNGQVENLIMDDDDFHIAYLIDYFKTHFKDDAYLQSVDIADPAHIVEVYLRDLGHMVFVNSTSYKNGKPNSYGKTGILMLPETVTEEQIESLNCFKEKISDYKELQVWSDLYRDENNIINGRVQSNVNSEKTVTEFVDYFIEQMKSKKK